MFRIGGNLLILCVIERRKLCGKMFRVHKIAVIGIRGSAIVQSHLHFFVPFPFCLFLFLQKEDHIRDVMVQDFIRVLGNLRLNLCF